MTSFAAFPQALPGLTAMNKGTRVLVSAASALGYGFRAMYGTVCSTKAPHRESASFLMPSIRRGSPLCLGLPWLCPHPQPTPRPLCRCCPATTSACCSSWCPRGRQQQRRLQAPAAAAAAATSWAVGPRQPDPQRQRQLVRPRAAAAPLARRHLPSARLERVGVMARLWERRRRQQQGGGRLRFSRRLLGPAAARRQLANRRRRRRRLR